MELEQWVAVAVVVALFGLIVIALTAMLVKTIVDTFGKWSKADYEKHAMLGRMEAIKEWQEAHGEDQNEDCDAEADNHEGLHFHRRANAMSKSYDRACIILPKSHYARQAEQENEERLSAQGKMLCKERAAVLLQAIEIAAGLQRTVYLVHCSCASRGKSSPIVFNDRTPNYAIRLDSDMYLRREAVSPDGTVKQCEEYT